MKDFIVDRSFWQSDFDRYNFFKNSQEDLSFIDSDFIRMYESSNLKSCSFCNGQLHRNVISDENGLVAVRFRCFNCPLDVMIDADGNDSFHDIDELYLSYCSQLKSAIKEGHHAN